MKKLFWKATLHFLRQISSVDINEQLLKENEYHHAELQVFKARFKKINKRPEKPQAALYGGGKKV